MESIKSSFLTAVARAFHGLDIAVFVMLFFISSMIFFSHGLFIGIYPPNMEPWERNTASWLMALGWEWTVLLTTCNPQYVHRSIPKIAAFASGLIVLFSVEAFDFSQPPVIIAQRWFMGILAGTISPAIADLVHKKWMHKGEADALPNEVASLKKQIAEIQVIVGDLQSAVTERDSQLSDLRSAVTERDSQLSHLRSAVTERDSQLSDLRSAVAERDSRLMDLGFVLDKVERCPYCEEQFKNRTSLSSHKRHCKKKTNLQLLA